MDCRVKPGHDGNGTRAEPQTGASPAGLTRGSIVLRKSLRRGWIAGSSPAMTAQCKARLFAIKHLARAVAQHEAGAAGAADAAAQALRGRARVGADAHLVERLRAAAAQQRAQQARVAPGEDLAVALGERRVARQRLVAREAGAKLHPPRRYRCEVHALLELLHERIGRAVEKRHQLAAAGLGDRR